MVCSIILTALNARVMAAAYIWMHAVALRCIAAVHMTQGNQTIRGSETVQ